MPDESPFGKWTTNEERIQELHNRLVGWWFASFVEGTELKGVWDDAFRRYSTRLKEFIDVHEDEEEMVMDTPKEWLLEAFEAALADHDHLLKNFPHEMPEGWEQWLPYPPKE